MDPNYTPPESETRQVYGISLQQRRNDVKIDAKLFENIVSQNKDVSPLTLSSRAIITGCVISYPNKP